MEQKWYIGIDVTKNRIQLSYISPLKKEPETVSLVMGEGRYDIPIQQPEGVSTAFLKEILYLIPGMESMSQIRGICVSLEQVDIKEMVRFWEMARTLGLGPEQVIFQEREESFCHFMLQQNIALRHQDVLLFDCEENQVTAMVFYRKQGISPAAMVVETLGMQILSELEEKRSREFEILVQKILEGREVSSIYLTGEGFEGDWWKSAATLLSQGHKAYQGKNLYTKGACYSAQDFFDQKTNQKHTTIWKQQGDALLEKEGYTAAILIYETLLKSKEISQETPVFIGKVYHNLGVAQARLFLFDQAAENFQKAYEQNQNASSFQAYEDTLQLAEEAHSFSVAGDPSPMAATCLETLRETYRQIYALGK